MQDPGPRELIQVDPVNREHCVAEDLATRVVSCRLIDLADDGHFLRLTFDSGLELHCCVRDSALVLVYPQRGTG